MEKGTENSWMNTKEVWKLLKACRFLEFTKIVIMAHYSVPQYRTKHKLPRVVHRQHTLLDHKYVSTEYTRKQNSSHKLNKNRP